MALIEIYCFPNIIISKEIIIEFLIPFLMLALICIFYFPISKGLYFFVVINDYIKVCVSSIYKQVLINCYFQESIKILLGNFVIFNFN